MGGNVMSAMDKCREVSCGYGADNPLATYVILALVGMCVIGSLIENWLNRGK